MVPAERAAREAGHARGAGEPERVEPQRQAGLHRLAERHGRAAERAAHARDPRAAVGVFRAAAVPERGDDVRARERAADGGARDGQGAGLDARGGRGGARQRRRGAGGVWGWLHGAGQVAGRAAGCGGRPGAGRAPVCHLQRRPARARARGQDQLCVQGLDGADGAQPEQEDRLWADDVRGVEPGGHGLRAAPEQRRRRLALGGHAEHGQCVDAGADAGLSDAQRSGVRVQPGECAGGGVYRRVQALAAHLCAGADGEL